VQPLRAVARAHELVRFFGGPLIACVGVGLRRFSRDLYAPLAIAGHEAALDHTLDCRPGTAAHSACQCRDITRVAQMRPGSNTRWYALGLRRRRGAQQGVKSSACPRSARRSYERAATVPAVAPVAQPSRRDRSQEHDFV